MPGFVSPYASAVTGNRLRPFPSAPLRTGLDTFASSGSPVALSFDWFLLILVCPRRSSGVDRDVASLADDEGSVPYGPHTDRSVSLWPFNFDLIFSVSATFSEMARSVSAVCISHPSTFQPSGHLPPFARCPAFPDSNYYGGSVALGLAPEGDLRFLHNLTSEHGLGPPFIPTPGLDRPVSHRAGLP